MHMTRKLPKGRSLEKNLFSMALQFGLIPVISLVTGSLRSIHIQWNLSNTDTLSTKIIVLFSEVSLFQGNTIYLYKVGTRSSVLIKPSVLILGVSFKRGSTVRL